jgi:lysosomal Pro-X carboxypeptidase
MRTSEKDYSSIKSTFNTCQTPSSYADVQSLIDTLTDSIGTMAMVDYPYPTSFIEPLPAWPVNYTCSVVMNTTDSLDALSAAGQVFYNYSGQLDCLDTSS